MAVLSDVFGEIFPNMILRKGNMILHRKVMDKGDC